MASVVLLTVLTVAGGLFTDAILMGRTLTASTFQEQHLHLLRLQWQESIAATDQESWEITDICFMAHGLRVAQRDDHLLFEHGDSAKAILLPPGATVSFGADSGTENALAILRVEWDDVLYRHHSNGSIQFIAAPESALQRKAGKSLLSQDTTP